jgi:hypothetical protein
VSGSLRSGGDAYRGAAEGRQPPAIAPMILNGSDPVAMASGSGSSGDSSVMS